MELFDEDFEVNEKTDNKKATTIILVLIIFFIIMVLLVVGFIIYIKQTTLTVKVDGIASTDVKNMIVFDEENPKKTYIPIRKIAKKFNYNDYNGSYTTKSEENNQCYVECENEVAMFSLGSNIIYKTLTNEEKNFENIEIDEAVRAINGELYTTIEGIEKAFNVSWNYDIENQKIEIYTMPYLIQAYSEGIVNYKYDKISEDFNNQKAVLDGMLIVERGEDSNNKKVAVLEIGSSELTTLLEPKYDDIKYLQRTQDFLVTADNKKGIISKAKKAKVKLQYDDIEIMDYDRKLCKVKISNKYGIINYINGEKVLDADYSEIGIDISDFQENDIRSKYIIANSLIPVKLGKIWAFFDTKGNQVTEFNYDGIGYITSNNKAGSGYSLLSVPDYDVIIVEKNKKYNVITTKGKEVFSNFFFDSIYLSIYGGKTSYVLDFDSKQYDLIGQLDALGYGKNTTKIQDEDKSEQSNENNNNAQQQSNKNNNNAQQQSNENSNNTQQQSNKNNNNAQQQSNENNNSGNDNN